MFELPAHGNERMFTKDQVTMYFLANLFLTGVLQVSGGQSA